MLAIFATAIFTAASLLFIVQPMIGKALLPLLGGSPAVWNTCMVFFQGVLLLGYLYSHVVTRYLSVKLQALLHVGLLVVAVLLPLQVELGVPDPASHPELANLYATSPAWWVVYMLGITVGVPFFVVSTSGPLLQKWFSRTDHQLANDPYFLYAASNAGSAVGLLAYPLLVEPSLALKDQSQWWSGGFVVMFALFVACIAVMMRRLRADTPTKHGASSLEETPISWSRRGRWVLLAFVPSSLLLGATQTITTDVAAIPLLWVIPLLLYLVSFMVVFSTKIKVSATTYGAWLLPAAVVSAGMMLASIREPMPVVVAVHLAVLTLAALMCHRLLAEDRPSATHLTEFYLMMSLGGVLGGAFNSLVAPMVFDRLLEYALVLGFVLLLRPQVRASLRSVPAWLIAVGAGGLVAVLAWQIEARYGLRLDFGMWEKRALVALPPIAVVLIAMGAKRPLAAGVAVLVAVGSTQFVGMQGKVLHTARTFFGVHRVVLRADGHWRAIVHGTTTHGLQVIPKDENEQALRLLSTSYYHPSGPLGEVFRSFSSRSMPVKVAIAGLGGGSIAGYSLPKEDGFRPIKMMRFFEIDPEVIRIATNPAYFTYLKDASTDIAVAQGDGRLAIAASQEGPFDLIILDAFTSDAIPVHLMTLDAVKAAYLPQLAPGGFIVFNVSNRHLNVAPVLGAIAKEAGLSAMHKLDLVDPKTDLGAKLGKQSSGWVVLARSRDDFAAMTKGASGWHALEPRPGIRAWTDEYSNILSVLR